MVTHAEVGGTGEALAAAYLRRTKGYAIVAHNWRNPQDRREEIDIVAREGEILVFVEVKTRKMNALVPGYFAVNRAKRAVLLRTAKAYLRLLARKPRTYRLDVVEIEIGGPDPVVRHFTNVGLFHRHYRP